MMRFKVIILDFDGTLIESVGIKDGAFKKLFKNYPKHLDKIMHYHLFHNATIRYEKFRYITEEILGQSYTEEDKEKLSKQFYDYVFDGIVKCSYVAGAEEFLNYFYAKIPLYIVSVSPADELKKIMDARGLRKYFKRIYAHPWLKKDAIQNIVLNENISNSNAVFIGDTLEDYKAANAGKIFFIARDSGGIFKKIDAPAYKNFVGIKNFVSQRIE